MANMLVQRMLDVIEREYTGILTLRTLSHAIGRQPAYLGRLFHQEVGFSFREYVTHVRLEHASELIKQGIKIEAVALSVGYRSKKNFYQRFKKQYGATPVQHRNRVGVTDTGCHRRLDTFGGRDPGAANMAPPDVPGGRTSPASRPGAMSEEMTSIIRASDQLCRVAVGAQHTLLQHLARSAVAVLLTNDAGRYMGGNDAAISVTGYSSLELRGLSPSDLFVSAPRTDTQRVWQLVVSPSGHAPNAVVRAKAGGSLDVYLMTLKNLLWGRPEMSTILEGLVPLAPAAG